MGSDVEIEDADKLDTYTSDDKGRVNLGQRYSDKEVQVAFKVIGDKEK